VNAVNLLPTLSVPATFGYFLDEHFEEDWRKQAL
jgi:hypothetical protein